MMKNIQAIPENVRQQIRQFFRDYQRVFKASKSTAFLLFLAFGFIGLFPVLELSISGNLLSSVVGARVIKVMNSDVEKFMWQQIALLLVILLPVFFAGNVAGVVRRLGWRTAEVFFITSVFISALPVAPISLFIVLISALLIGYVENRYIKLGYSFAILLLMSLQFATILNVTVHRGAHIEEFVLWGGSLLIFSFWFALRPHIQIES